MRFRGWAATIAVLVQTCNVGCTPYQRKVALGASSHALILMDAHQTAGNVARCDELNPIIGHCGGGVPIPLYFTVMLVANFAGDYYLPEWFPALVTGAELSTVASLYVERYHQGWYK